MKSWQRSSEANIFSCFLALHFRILSSPSARTITWIRFTVINSAGTDLGLAEIEVWQSGASKPAETTDKENFSANADAPRHFALSPLCPNPFNAETVFRFHFPQNGHILAVIHDPMGKEIMLLYYGMMSLGRQSLRRGKNQNRHIMGTRTYLLRVEYVGSRDSERRRCRR